MDKELRKCLLHPKAEAYIKELEAKLEDEQMKMLNLCCESMTVGFGKEQATLWKESIEKPLLEKLESAEDALMSIINSLGYTNLGTLSYKLANEHFKKHPMEDK